MVVCICGFCNVWMFGFCNVWMCVYVGFVMCGCVSVCRRFGNMCTCIYCVLYCFFYVYLFLFDCIILRTTANE